MRVQQFLDSRNLEGNSDTTFSSVAVKSLKCPHSHDCVSIRFLRRIISQYLSTVSATVADGLPQLKLIYIYIYIGSSPDSDADSQKKSQSGPKKTRSLCVMQMACKHMSQLPAQLLWIWLRDSGQRNACRVASSKLKMFTTNL